MIQQIAFMLFQQIMYLIRCLRQMWPLSNTKWY